ncbi:MAG: pyridoxal phosphate-dependent aminotransferase family protein, partial [Sphaerochaetaceae bacterium]
IDGKEMVMFGSNNYLGLANDERLKEASKAAIDHYGTSCSGSRFMNGTLELHEELEHKLAKFLHKESALCFTTGYQSNLGALSALVNTNEHFLIDKYDHASIMDGLFLAQGMKRGINLHRFKHNDVEDLERLLAKIPHAEGKVIVIDGVFSMEGDITPLPAIRALADQYNAALYLDEAHAVGVLGESGRGTCEYYGGDYALSDITMCTFSKSFGSIGGFVAGDNAVVDYIKHFARPLIFSASMPPANLAAAIKALEIIESEPERIARLRHNGDLLREGLQALGFDTGESETPIIPLIVGDNDKTFLLWKNSFERGLYVNPVISPAVPPQRSLLRISCMATHDEQQIEFAIEVLKEEGAKLGLI